MSEEASSWVVPVLVLVSAILGIFLLLAVLAVVVVLYIRKKRRPETLLGANLLDNESNSDSSVYYQSGLSSRENSFGPVVSRENSQPTISTAGKTKAKAFTITPIDEEDSLLKWASSQPNPREQDFKTQIAAYKLQDESQLITQENSDGTIKAASHLSLVSILVFSQDKQSKKYKDLYDVFFATYTSFLSPFDLLSILAAFYEKYSEDSLRVKAIYDIIEFYITNYFKDLTAITALHSHENLVLLIRFLSRYNLTFEKLLKLVAVKVFEYLIWLLI
jgi:hypothetical protein